MREGTSSRVVNESRTPSVDRCQLTETLNVSKADRSFQFKGNSQYMHTHPKVFIQRKSLYRFQNEEPSPEM